MQVDQVIRVRIPGPIRITRSGRGIDQVVATRTFSELSGKGWVDANDLLNPLGRTWKGSPRISGPIRSIGSTLGYRIEERFFELGMVTRLSVRIQPREFVDATGPGI